MNNDNDLKRIFTPASNIVLDPEKKKQIHASVINTVITEKVPSPYSWLVYKRFLITPILAFSLLLFIGVSYSDFLEQKQFDNSLALEEILPVEGVVSNDAPSSRVALFSTSELAPDEQGISAAKMSAPLLNIEYTHEGLQKSYSKNDVISIQVHARNISQYTETIQFTNACETYYYILSVYEELPLCAEVISQRTIAPGEQFTWNIDIDLKDFKMSAGSYTLSFGVFTHADFLEEIIIK